MQFTCTSCAPGKGAKRKDPVLTKLDLILRQLENQGNLLDNQEKRLKDMEQATGGLEPQTLDRKIEEAVEKKLIEMHEEHEEKEKIKLNLVITNVPESKKTEREERRLDDLQTIKSKMEEIAPGTGLKNEVFNPFRLGTYEAGKPARPIKFSVRNEAAKEFILLNASKMHQTTTDNRKKIWINKDQTRKERQTGKALRDELKRRIAAGETDLIIRGGKIIKKRVPAVTQAEAETVTQAEAETVDNRNLSDAGPSSVEGAATSE